MRSKFPIVLSICLLIVLAAASPVDAFLSADLSGVPRQGTIYKLLGETRSVFSNIAILTADQYYHGGVGHHDHQNQDVLCLLIDDEDCHDHHQEQPDIGKYNILLRVGSEVEVTGHMHMSGETLSEIMPWLDYAVRIDPYNELAYVLGAFYLSERFGREKEAIALLRQGLSLMPESMELNTELGRIYLLRQDNVHAAIRYLSIARRAMRQREPSLLEKRQILSLLANAYEKASEFSKAYSVYEELLDIFPGSTSLRKHLKRIEGRL